MLPNAALAFVEPSKVRDYLLSQSHPVGRFKSVVFMAIGYAQDNWQKLRDDLLVLAQSGVAAWDSAVPMAKSTRLVVT